LGNCFTGCGSFVSFLCFHTQPYSGLIMPFVLYICLSEWKFPSTTQQEEKFFFGLCCISLDNLKCYVLLLSELHNFSINCGNLNIAYSYAMCFSTSLADCSKNVKWAFSRLSVWICKVYCSFFFPPFLFLVLVLISFRSGVSCLEYFGNELLIRPYFVFSLIFIFFKPSLWLPFLCRTDCLQWTI
jgi:hypothetical protein